MLLFAATLPGTPDEALVGLGGAVLMRASHESRPPGTACWVDGVPAHARAGDHALLAANHPDSAAVRSRGLRVWWRCRSPSEVQEAISARVAVWLHGAEGPGRTGRSTALVLIRALAAAEKDQPVTWVAAGLTPGARAASVAVGAAGIVLDTELWTLPESPVHPDRRRILERAGPRDTHLLGDVEGIGVRVWAPRETVDRLRARVQTEGIQAIEADLEGWWLRPDGPLPAPVSLGTPAHGSAADRIEAARTQVRAHLATIPDHHPLRTGCDPLGTGVPIVQGPMANVAEGADLARAVSEAGALPFVALGALRPAEADAVLDGVASLPQCGAGLIAFDVAPHRDAHIASLVARPSRPVILAGGTPTLAASLAERGLDPWLHTPSPRLAGFAVASGVRTIVLEGHEAGGHVGPIPSTALWDLALGQAMERQRPDAPPLVVLAGGIGDAVSAAFAAALSAPACAAGVRVALQVGTAFFFTREIVSSGQLTATCQDAAVQAERTVLVGESVQLPLRCAPNGFTELARAEEARWQAEGLDLRERRRRMEQLNLGRTRMAAKGVERDPDWDGADPARRLRPIDAERARRDGAFTLGQGASTTRELQSVAELVQCLTAGARAHLERQRRWGHATAVEGAPSPVTTGPDIAVPLGRIRGGPSRSSGPTQPPAGGRIAIVGMGCVLPGGPDLLGWWRSQVRGVDAIRTIPHERWDPARYADPDAGASGPGRSASTAAGVAARVPFDPLRYRIPPSVLPTVDRAQRLALLAGDEALTEAGLLDADPARSSVILGNAMGGEWRSKMALRVRFREVLDRLELDEAARASIADAVEHRLDREVVPLQGESMVGLLGNVAAARVAAWLDWRGGSHTVDGACAASLLAIVNAVEALRSGRVDLVLSGGVDTDLAIDTYVGFTRTRALSSAGSRPFSRDADGFVMGEGAACFALVRLEDAVRRSLPVWAIIDGIGTSSDGRARGLTAPDPDGQRLAIERAWADAGRDPSTAAYVEAHGTGTQLGDRTEASVLSQVFGDVWVGTAKGAIGHLKSAAGAAGLLRGALAAATGILPPTQHVGPPIEAASALRLVRQPTAIDGGVDSVGISAFGFGGTNAHLVLSAAPAGLRRPAALEALRAIAAPFLVSPERARWTPSAPPSPARLTPSAGLHLFQGDSREALADAVRQRRHAPLMGAVGLRLAVLIDPTQHDEDARLDEIAMALARGEPPPRRDAWLDDTKRAIVVVAPGQGAQRPGALSSVLRFSAADDLSARLEEALGGGLDAPDASDTRALHRHLFGVSGLWAMVLREAGVPIHGALGHSLGELAALVASGATDAVSLAPVVRARGEALHRAPPGQMLAVLGDADAFETLARRCALHVAARNSDRAGVLAGREAGIAAARELAPSLGLRTRILAVPHAFHTPDMGPAKRDFERALSELPPTAPSWWSAVEGATGTPREALAEALVRPVDFGPRLEHLAPTDALVVELGPGRTLCGHARTLGLRAVALDPDPGSDPHGPIRAAAALWASGHPELLRACPQVDLRIATERRAVGAAAFAARAPEASLESPPVVLPGVSVPAAPSVEARPLVQGSIRDQVLSALQQITGYEPDTLASAGDLQADLGIDSIQRLEVVGLLQEALSLRLRPEDEAALEGADVDGLVAIVEASLGRDTPSKTSDTGRAWLLTEDWLPTATSVDEAGVWMRPEVGADLATDLVKALAGLPDHPQRVLLEVPDTPHGRGLAAGLRCAAAERGQALTELRISEGAPTPSPRTLPPGEVYRWAHEGLLRRRWRPRRPTPPTSGGVILATGGVRGIVPTLVSAMAPERALILGRTPAEALADELEALPPSIEYARADVTDPDAVRRALDRFGRLPDRVLHGAAVLRDRPHDGLDADDVREVLAPKLVGLAKLRTLLPEAEHILISSIAAHTGSPGQAAYAAANAMAEGLADRAVALTAVADRGLAASAHVRAALRTRGVRPLPLATAGELVASSLNGESTHVLVTTHPPTRADWPIRADERDGAATILHLALDADHPALRDHRVAGRAVVPAATWVHLALERTTRIEDFHIEAPVFVDDTREDVAMKLSKAALSIQAGAHTFATARLRPAAEGADGIPGRFPTRDASPLYREDLLFHGPHWQVLERIGGDGNGTLQGILRPSTELDGSVDAAHQLLACWSAITLGWTGLPVAAKAWTRFPGGAPTRVEVRPRADEDSLQAEVLAWDAAGTVVLCGEGVRLQRVGRVSAEAASVLRRVGLGGHHD